MIIQRGEHGLLLPNMGIQTARVMPGGLPGAFSPPDIAGLQLWLKADAITGLNDGDALTTWEDSHTSNNDFTQATAGKKPTYQTNEINGLPVVRFDGTDVLTAANFLSSSEGTIFAVVRHTTALQDNQTLLASGDEGSNFYYVWTRSYSTSATPNAEVSQKNSDTVDALYGSTTIVAGTTYLMTWHSSGTAYSLRVNGAAETLTIVTGANTGDWFGDTSLLDNFSLGAIKRALETGFLKGDVGEVIMYDTGLSAGDITSVETYLNARWAAF